jgi:RNA polymerase sigma factor (sigma-70 family)
MAHGRLVSVLRALRQNLNQQCPPDTLSDAQLLSRFAGNGDEAAFEALLRRHGPLVLGLCRRLLANPSDADDAFQATFLVLARKAAAIRRRSSVASWLYGVAFRVARRARGRVARQHLSERQVGDVRRADELADQGSCSADADPPSRAVQRELQQKLDAELQALPEKYRAPLVLCYLQGKTNEEAARELGWPVGSISRRLTKARDLLRGRLSERGLAVPGALLASVLAEQQAPAVPSALLEATLRTAKSFPAGQAPAVAAPAITLAQGALSAMKATKIKIAAVVLAALGLLGASAGVFLYGAAADEPAPLPQALPAAPGPRPANNGPAALPAPPAALRDLQGDPLPEHARARLGSVRFRQGDAVASVRYLPDGKTLVSVGSDQAFRFWEAGSGKELQRFTGSAMRTLSPDGQSLATVHANQSIQVTDTSTGKERCRIGSVQVGGDNLYSLPTFSPDSKLLAASVFDQNSKGSIRLWDAGSGKEVRRLTCPPLEERQLLFAPRAFVFAPAGKYLATTHADGRVVRIWIWDLDTGKLMPELAGHAVQPDQPQPPPTAEAAVPASYPSDSGGLPTFLPDSKTVADVVVQSKNNKDGQAPTYTLRLWEVATGKPIRDLGSFQSRYLGRFFAPDGKTLALTTDAQMVQAYDVTTGKVLWKVSVEPTVGIHAVVFAPDSRSVLVAGQDQSIRLHDARTGQELRRLHHPGETPGLRTLVAAGPGFTSTPVAFSPDGKSIVATSGAMVRQWSVSTGKELRPVGTGHEGAISGLALSPDGKTAATAGGDNTVRLWDLASSREIRRFQGPTPEPANGVVGVPPRARSVAFSPDGRHLAAGWSEGSIHVWDTESGKQLRHFQGADRTGITCVAFIHEGKALLAQGDDGRVMLSDVTTGKQRPLAGRPAARNDAPDALLPPQALSMSTSAVSLDGKTVAVACQDGDHYHINLWELASGKVRRKLHIKVETDGPAYYAVPPAPAPVAATAAAEAAPVYTETAYYGGGIAALAFTPDGRSLAWTTGNTTRLWDLDGDREVKRFGGQKGLVRAAVFSPDGKLLAAAGEDGSVQLWDTASGVVLGQLRGHRGGVTSLAFTADGQALASGGTDTCVLLWDVKRFLERRTPDDRLTAEQLRIFWDQLGGTDSERVFALQRKLVAAPEPTVSSLGDHLAPVQPVNAAHLAQHLDDLESADLARRTQATRELEKLADLAEAGLRQRLAGSPPLEVQQRIEQLLEKLLGPVADPERLRTWRAIEVLEQIGTPEARAVLRKMATGAAESRTTREAQASLKRLSQRR